MSAGPSNVFPPVQKPDSLSPLAPVNCSVHSQTATEVCSGTDKSTARENWLTNELPQSQGAPQNTSSLYDSHPAPGSQ